MKLREAMEYARDYATVDAWRSRTLRMPLQRSTEILARLRAEVNRLTARLERAERERDEARQLINALEKSAEKYEAWVDENMRMI